MAGFEMLALILTILVLRIGSNTYNNEKNIGSYILFQIIAFICILLKVLHVNQCIILIPITEFLIFWRALVK